MAMTKIPKGTIRRMDEELRSFLSPEDYQDFAHRTHARGFFDKRLGLGADLSEEYKIRTAGIVFNFVDANMMEMPHSREEFKRATEDVIMPAYRKTKTNTIAWFLMRMKEEAPEIYQELLDAGANMDNAEFVSSIGSVVTCDFYDDNGVMLATVENDVSRHLWNISWVS